MTKLWVSQLKLAGSQFSNGVRKLSGRNLPTQRREYRCRGNLPGFSKVSVGKEKTNNQKPGAGRRAGDYCLHNYINYIHNYLSLL